MKQEKQAAAKTAAGQMETRFFASASDWTAWLKANHAGSAGLWLRIAKKNADQPSVTYAEAVEVALCYGWIDGQRKTFDDQTFVQRFTPRAARSIWSKVNRDKALALIANRKMRAPGLREIDRAKQDGRWDAAYESQRGIKVPDDLQQALAKSAKAATFFEALTSQNRYAILFRLHHAKKPETRLRRLETFVAMLKAGETIYPQGKKAQTR